MLGSSFVGMLGALGGFLLAYFEDFPVGPTDVALLGLIYGVSIAGKRLWQLRRRVELPH
jgi:ABC-type Mn2+/Zn2+ transport system permease subunit